MSIEIQKRFVTKVMHVITSLEAKYPYRSPAAFELRKLNTALTDIDSYLNKLDHLQPNLNTSEVNKLVEAANLHVDILKEALEKEDYQQLAKAMKALKTVLKFHATRYTSLQFLIAWFLEWIYFI